jgi:hypothetical protein
MSRIILSCALAGVLSVPAFGQGVDPYIGTWRLNLEKSTFIGQPTPKSFTLTWSKEAQHLIATLDQVNSNGAPNKIVFMMNFDGQPHPVTGIPIFNSVTYTRFGNTINVVYFKDGKTAAIGQYTIVSGKNTYTGEGVRADGQPYHLNLVYEKQ